MFAKLSALVLVSAGALSLWAQSAANQSSLSATSSTSSSTTVTVPPRYFVEVIGISAPTNSQPSKSTKPAACTQGKDSGITLELPERVYVGDASFAISAKAANGQAVAISCTGGACCSGPSCALPGFTAELEAPKDPTDPYMFTPKNTGAIQLQATAAGCPATTKPLNIEDNQKVCIDGIEPRSTPSKPAPGAAAIVQNLGNPYPFTFQASASKILIYSARMPLRTEDWNRLKDFKRQIAQLIEAGAATASDPSKPAYSVELAIPHAAPLGDLATKLGTLNYTDFKVQDIGSDQVRIISAGVPTCSQLTAYLRDIRHLVWKPRPENPVTKVFNTDATAVSTAIATPAAGGGSGSGNAAGGGTSGAGSPSPTGGATTSQGAAPATTSGTITASATVTNIAAAPASSGSGAPAGTTAGGASSGASTPTAAAATAPSTTANAVGTDLLVFSDGVIGDDATIAEKKRLIALLDLPRPQVILNVWTAQTSSKDKKVVGDQTNGVTDFVKQYNDTLQGAINAGWKHLRSEIENPNAFFDRDFYTYLVGRYAEVAQHTGSTPQERAQEVVAYSSITSIPSAVRTNLGFCPADKFCLGYVSLFQPITPRLTDLLIAVIASNHPVGEVDAAISAMENAPGGQPVVDEEMRQADALHPTCVTKDRVGASTGHFYLECFKNVADNQLLSSGDQPNLLGLLRASLADFLFQYKVSQVYPHEFSAYQLTQSAHTLDSALAPLIDAFNRDLAAYQTEMATLLKVQAKSQGWGGSEKDTFVNQGMITVRTISGIDTTVNTTTQSFLDVTQQPTLSALASSIAGAKQSDTTTGAHMTDVFQNLKPIQAQVILGAVAAFQSSKVQIGRSLNIDVTPKSLSGADAAELSIKLNVDESASPTYYTSSSSAADTSRVATHDTNTHVRVDSIKLFSVSTMTAELQKARTRFPLLPPLVEIPYVGTLVGVPLPAAKEFHSSSAVISAIIVPTASDIALGLQFTDDFIVDSDGATNCYYPTGSGGIDANGMALDAAATARLPRCRFRRVSNLNDIDQFGAVSLFHKQMITCIANGSQKGTPTISPNPDGTVNLATTTDCNHLSLYNLELSAQ